jgi:two-component system LytT family response regulator
MTWTALIVDDEAPARQRLRDLLSQVADFDVGAECEDGPSAVLAVPSLQPDLLFLDVQMPEMTGFEVLARVGVSAVPAVVFVSAYDRHALAAFDHRAVDYLLKPFTGARFDDTLDRVRRRLSSGTHDQAARLSALLDDTLTLPDRLPVPTREGTRLLALDDVGWVESDGNYVVVHAGGERFRLRATMKFIEARLAPAGFLRVHQSYLVNAHHIEALKPWSHGEIAIHLRGGTTLVSSRTYSDAVRRLMEL